MGDVPVLTDFFLVRYGPKYGVRIDGVTAAARRVLLRHSWPGNVRELEKAIDRAVIYGSDDRWIRPDHFGLPTKLEVNGVVLSQRQRELLELAAACRVIRRGDVTARFGISGEAARRELAGLVNAGLLRREGFRRGTRYTLV